MEILNIGPLELVLIVLIALIFLGPKETVNAMRKLGAMIAKVAKSPYWSTIMNTSKEIREFPNMIVRESGLDESIKELRKTSDSLNKDIKDINKTITLDLEEAGKMLDGDEIINRKDIPKIQLDAEKKEKPSETNESIEEVTEETNDSSEDLIKSETDESQNDKIDEHSDSSTEPESETGESQNDKIDEHSEASTEPEIEAGTEKTEQSA